MGRDAVALTDGGMDTSLLFHEGFDLPCFASFRCNPDWGAQLGY